MTSGLDNADPVSVFRLLHFFGCGARVDQPFHHAILNQMHVLTAHPFAVKGHARL